MKSSINVNSDNTAKRAQKLTKYQKQVQQAAKEAVSIKAISNAAYRLYMGAALLATDAQAYIMYDTIMRLCHKKKDQDLLKRIIQNNQNYRRYLVVTNQYQYPRIP